VLKKFDDRLNVDPVKRSRLVEITFESADPALAARVVNSLASNYIEENLEARWQASEKASDWLSQQLMRMKAKLEKSEDELQKYSRENGLLFLSTEKGTTENIVDQRLHDLQEELTKAQADRYQKESLYRLVQEGDFASLPGVFDDKLLQDLSERLAELKRQRSQLATTFNPDYPRVKGDTKPDRRRRRELDSGARARHPHDYRRISRRGPSRRDAHWRLSPISKGRKTTSRRNPCSTTFWSAKRTPISSSTRGCCRS
jgi:uncharacterized protein involved in exopolysaccharide biosynthesis